MTRPYQILLPLLGLFLVRVDLTDLFPLKIMVKVIKIYDGDTLLVGIGSFQSKIRLSKIDAPEKKQPFLINGGDAGEFSTSCLKELLSGEVHELKVEKLDIYGRILGDLDDISFRLIESGCASIYPYASFDSQRQKFDFLKALKNAKATHRGLWNYGGFIQPKKWRKISKQTLLRR